MTLIDFYKENAQILKQTFTEMGFEVYGECVSNLMFSTYLDDIGKHCFQHMVPWLPA